MPEKDLLFGVHYADFELLKEIDRICKKYSITYFLIAGTLLGAIRHRDFIPWDDDVDIALTRPEYNRLMNIIDSELGQGFEHVNPHTDKCFFDAISKINYLESEIHIPTDEDKFYQGRHNRVSLDIFVLDSACDGLKYKLQLATLKMLYGLAMAYRYKTDYKKYSFSEKLKVFVLSNLGRLFSVDRIMRWYDRVSLWGSKDGKYCFISNDQFKNIALRYEKVWFSSTKNVTLRKTEFPAPVGAEQMLSTIYGNFMSPPPANERKPLHINASDAKVFAGGIPVVEASDNKNFQHA